MEVCAWILDGSDLRRRKALRGASGICDWLGSSSVWSMRMFHVKRWQQCDPGRDRAFQRLGRLRSRCDPEHSLPSAEDSTGGMVAPSRLPRHRERQSLQNRQRALRRRCSPLADGHPPLSGCRSASESRKLPSALTTSAAIAEEAARAAPPRCGYE